MKKNLNFFKIAKSCKFAVECVSNDIVSYKWLLHPTCEVFRAEKQKGFKVGKMRKYDEEKEHFQNKHFHLLKKHLYQNGKRKYAIGSGRLVMVSSLIDALLKFNVYSTSFLRDLIISSFSISCWSGRSTVFWVNYQQIQQWLQWGESKISDFKVHVLRKKVSRGNPRYVTKNLYDFEKFTKTIHA